MGHTLVDQLKFGDDVESNLRELILEHLKKHGQKMINSPRNMSTKHEEPGEASNSLLLPKDGCQSADLSAESSPDMLRSIGYEVLNAAHDVV